MSITQYNESQLEILNKGLEKINDLFSLLNIFEPMIESSHAAMRLQEGFMWFEQMVKNGVKKENDFTNNIVTTSPLPSSVDGIEK
jgi:hypothetical protein